MDDMNVVKDCNRNAFSKRRADGMWDVYLDTDVYLASGYSCADAWRRARTIVESSVSSSCEIQ